MGGGGARSCAECSCVCCSAHPFLTKTDYSKPAWECYNYASPHLYQRKTQIVKVINTVKTVLCFHD